MGIFNRMTKTFKANVNSVMDKIEDPAVVLEQEIIDMERAYSIAKKSVAGAKAEEIKLNKRVDELEEEIAKWVSNAKLALSKGDEDLARRALVKKKEVGDELQLIAADRDNIAGHTLKLVEDLKEMERKVLEAKRKKDILKSRMETAKAKKKIMETKASIDGIGEGAFSSFNKMEEKANKIINETDAMEDLNRSLTEKNLEDEFKKLQNNGDVDLELENLRKELGQ